MHHMIALPFQQLFLFVQCRHPFFLVMMLEVDFVFFLLGLVTSSVFCKSMRCESTNPCLNSHIRICRIWRLILEGFGLDAVVRAKGCRGMMQIQVVFLRIAIVSELHEFAVFFDVFVIVCHDDGWSSCGFHDWI